MSYDIDFVRRHGSRIVSRRDIESYFRAHEPNARISERQAVYENAFTGVSFVFDFESERGVALTLFLNLVRPSVFALEAADVIERLTKALPLDLDDAQLEKRGPFDRSAFLKEWTEANRFGIRTNLAVLDHNKTLPRDVLVSQWHWNSLVQHTDQQIEGTAAPKILYRYSNSNVRSIVAVLIGTEYTVPAVDDVVLGRSLHKRMGQPQFAASVVPFAEIANACNPVESPIDGIRCVRTAGDAVLEAIAARSIVRPKNDGITIDQILDRESFAP